MGTSWHEPHKILHLQITITWSLKNDLFPIRTYAATVTTLSLPWLHLLFHYINHFHTLFCLPFLSHVLTHSVTFLFYVIIFLFLPVTSCNSHVWLSMQLRPGSPVNCQFSHLDLLSIQYRDEIAFSISARISPLYD